jgi:hypothetical protein
MSLDNLGIFTTCTNAQLGPLLTSLKNADVSAGNVVVTAPETNTCEALMPQLSAIGPVRWTHQPTDGEHSWADCGGNDPNSLLDDTLQCYRKKLVASTPQGAVFSGIGVTDEKPDGDFSCGGVSDVPVKAVIMGAWSRRAVRDRSTAKTRQARALEAFAWFLRYFVHREPRLGPPNGSPKEATSPTSLMRETHHPRRRHARSSMLRRVIPRAVMVRRHARP